VRRRLATLGLAITTLVVVSFVVPLALLVRRQAADGAKVRAEGDAQSVAGLVGLALALGDASSVAGTVGDLPEGTIVIHDGSIVAGTRLPGQGDLAGDAAETGSTVTGPAGGGWEIALPVVAADGIVVVDSFAPASELTQGVAAAWALLGLLGLLLVAAAVWVADRMGRELIEPIEDLAETAHALAEGDLEARVMARDPPEIKEVGEAINYLASRLDQLLTQERENAADLSHQLRTPLTALRLQTEAMSDDAERTAMMGHVDRLEHSINRVIELARSPSSSTGGISDIEAVVAERVGFWRALADEQGRVTEESLGFAGQVKLGEDEVRTIVDTLIENVFTHTPAGAGFRVATGSSAGRPWLEVADRGPGIGGDLTVERGLSGRGSTGLGLDIVRKLARGIGGDLEMGDRSGGGTVARVYLGPGSD